MVTKDSSIFRAYDIRGIVGRDFDADWVERLGRACGAYFLSLGHTRAVVGHDCRLTSPEFQERLVRGLAATGVDVLFLDMVPTPVCYFAIRHLGYKAGVMITASHNPSEYNGFKVWAGKSTIHSGEIQKLAALMQQNQFPAGNGLATYHDIAPAYLETVSALVKLKRRVKVVLDGGNGAAGLIARDLLTLAGAEVIELYCDPDGRFPNHHPDPVDENNLGALKAKVLETGAEAGIGLDGDGDRIGVVDQNAQVIHGDRLLAIFARQVLAEKPASAIIGDVKCSHLLFQDIARHGGRPIMSATGHSLIKDRLLTENAALAGEMSGHMFFADRYYGFDDAPYAALRLVEILSGADSPVSQFLEDWPATFVTPELRVDCPEHIKFAVADKARDEFAKAYTLEGDDGARLVFPDGWALVRASNTQPALVLRFEAESAERLAELRSLVEVPLARWIAEMT
ncbi:MAG: phosphomannomutase/phosphoglucomutase [Humidesulfovibrio sp.]|uniref:phosphomannomutase/phosphoglucomutase n=1 Tax=Humidesulfovibrio sp. TaxID=2910988 RepID=UPI002733F99A|nr:phosphomannomutase/phosphoglucomutase [Humidesulfovibrio sp.]MDP2847675.1 phosphomannomutase/phosphoglucomutase [Humidesulfovibrio sp.]